MIKSVPALQIFSNYPKKCVDQVSYVEGENTCKKSRSSCNNNLDYSPSINS